MLKIVLGFVVFGCFFFGGGQLQNHKFNITSACCRVENVKKFLLNSEETSTSDAAAVTTRKS